MIWLGEILIGETVPIRAQFHDDTGTAADPATPFARMETGAGTFTSLTTPAKIDAKVGYYGTNIVTTGYAEGIRTVRIGGTVATDKVVAAVYGFRMVAARAETATQASVWTNEKASFVDASIASRSTFVDGGNVNATNMVAAPDNIGIATLVGRPAPTNAVTPVTDLTVTNAKIDAAKNSADEANRIAPATPANVTTAQVVITDAIDAKPVTPATDISEVSSVVELLAKYMKNELQRLDNGDGTITVTLLDDDDLTPLLTWTYQVATTTREKAV